MSLLKYWFIPSIKNNYRAKVLHPDTLILLLCFAFFQQSLVRSYLILNPKILGTISSVNQSSVLDLTNLERQKYKLPPLKLNKLLSDSAQHKAGDIVQKNYWSHSSPEGNTPWDFIKHTGYEYSVAGENLARDYTDTASLLKAWMKSPTHRNNILNNDFTEIGIGITTGIQNGIYTTIIVQHFAKPIISSNRVSQIPKILASQTKSLLNPSKINKIFLFFIIIFVIIAFAVDGYVANKKNLNRFRGSSVGHFFLLLFFVTILIYAQKGKVF
jgi:uncharacterized protein YkwD